MHISLGLLLLLWGLVSAQAEPLNCSVCNQPITEKFLWQVSHLSLDKRPVCVPCSKLETACFICGFPVKTYTVLEDGRLLCEQDVSSEAYVLRPQGAAGQDGPVPARELWNAFTAGKLTDVGFQVCPVTTARPDESTRMALPWSLPSPFEGDDGSLMR